MVEIGAAQICDIEIVHHKGEGDFACMVAEEVVRVRVLVVAVIEE